MQSAATEPLGTRSERRTFDGMNRPPTRHISQPLREQLHQSKLWHHPRH